MQTSPSEEVPAPTEPAFVRECQGDYARSVHMAAIVSELYAFYAQVSIATHQCRADVCACIKARPPPLSTMPCAHIVQHAVDLLVHWHSRRAECDAEPVHLQLHWVAQLGDMTTLHQRLAAISKAAYCLDTLSQLV